MSCVVSRTRRTRSRAPRSPHPQPTFPGGRSRGQPLPHRQARKQALLSPRRILVLGYWVATLGESCASSRRSVLLACALVVVLVAIAVGSARVRLRRPAPPPPAAHRLVGRPRRGHQHEAWVDVAKGPDGSLYAGGDYGFDLAPALRRHHGRQVRR